MTTFALYQAKDGSHLKTRSALERSDLACTVDIRDGEPPAGLDVDVDALASLAGDYLPGEWSGAEPCRLDGREEDIRFMLRYGPAWRDGEPTVVGISAGAYRGTEAVASIDLAGTVAESRHRLRTSVRETARQLREATLEAARERARRWDAIADSLD